MMHSADLPPLPKAGEVGPQVCDIVRLYLAVIDDLTPEQIEILSRHVVTCAACSEEFSLLERSTHLVGSLAASMPSARVDRAIQGLLAGVARPPVAIAPVYVRQRSRPPRRVARVLASLAAAAAILFALFLSAQFLGFPGQSQAFALPATLSWSQYVLFHSEVRTNKQGETYRVDTYHDLGTGDIHVETTMDGSMDIVAVGNAREILGLDMMHRVAQMGANSWSVDDSMFDLAQLRRDMQTRGAVYLDTETFKGQQVYRIRCNNGLVLLLDMQYRPVNVLRNVTGPGTGTPVYTTLTLMPTSQVPASMWDMSVPPDFHMGTLPKEP